MGNENSGANSSVCTGKNAPGLNAVCFQRGYDAAQMSTDPNAIGDGLDALPCTFNANANKCYAQGIQAGRNENNTNNSNNASNNLNGTTINNSSGFGTITKTAHGEYFTFNGRTAKVAPGRTMEGTRSCHYNNGYIYPG